MNKMFEDDIISHAESIPTEEVCGFIILEPNFTVTVERQINENPYPDNCFTISQSQFLDYKLTKNILGIYHSHPTSSEEPSSYDKSISEESGVPYLTYSLKTKKFHLYYPKSYEVTAFLGRPYIKGFHECSCILKDYFVKTLGINITAWNKNYWLPKEDLKANKLLLRILNKNLILINKEDIQEHDVLLFELKEGRRLHLGISSGPNVFVHQPLSTLSREEVLDNRWQNKIKSVYRHESLV